MEKIDKKNVEEVISLTPMEEGMLFYYIYTHDTTQYFQQLSILINSDVDVEIFKKSWNYVVSNNEMLRAIFRWKQIKKPVQIILKNFELKIKMYDFSYQLEDDEYIINDILINDLNRKIDITTEPLRVSLCKLNDNKYLMILNYHHILLDGWSTGIVLKEFIIAYSSFMNNEKPIKPIKGKFKEYVKWLEIQDKSAQKKYWINYFQDFKNFDKKFLKDNNIKNDECKNWKYSIKLDNELVNNIDNFKRVHKLTFATIIYTAWGILLHKFKFIDDVIFGTTVSGRQAEIKNIKNMVGLFINTLPHRFKIDYNKTVLELLKENFNKLLVRQEYEYTSLSDINSYANIQPTKELFDTVIVIQNYPLDKVLLSESTTLNLNFRSIFETTQYDLTVVISMIDYIKIDFIYNNKLFNETYIRKLSNLFSNILKSIIKYPKATIEQYMTEYLFIEENLSKNFFGEKVRKCYEDQELAVNNDDFIFD
ncbi:condensation domain-containing protein [Clostridium frigidicarnis]|uniref:Condensation domain-containing protein n=1 Tax=Clostridium frigidicarnis TaxID=84698 RepID=A0A1I0Y2S6_9CLOT|nr:condensation domain-containing protein [Clostridium frigidicarnis]SFB07669.1 Condensation domain-containing protein [Clostridium frigidicarnis]